MTSGADIAISGGWTAVVAVAGFSTAIWTTRKTLKAARDARMWDKRAEVYVDVIAAVNYRSIKREHDMRTWTLQPEDARREEAYLAAYTPPDWYQLEARMAAFASHDVHHAAQVSSIAEDHARSAGKSRLDDDAKDRAEAARKAAEQADGALVELIRTELQGKGKGRPLAEWEPLRVRDSRQE